MSQQRPFATLASLAVASMAISSSALGQTFSSGSTGADGTLNLTGNQTIQVPASGVFNYTTVNIPAGTTLSFANNLSNTPVIMLAQGNVTISGTVNVSAPAPLPSGSSSPGPGGFYGGDAGTPGWGPGGGAATPTPTNGQWTGPLSLFPNIGGGGAGGGNFYGGPYCGQTNPLSGGGGGGAITIASSTAISVSSTGSIQANGSYLLYTSSTCYATGTTGAGGAVRLVANSVNVSGYVCGSLFRMEAPQGGASYSGGSGSCTSESGNPLSGSGNPATPVIATINPEVTPNNPPSLQIVSIGGYAVPPNSGSSFTTIDLLLPNQLQDPIAVVVQATNVPTGSPVTIDFNNSPSATFPAAYLAGTNASSTATLYVSGLSRTAVVYLFVYTTFEASQISDNINQFDPTAVSMIEVASAIGHRSRYRFLRADGTEVLQASLPFDLKQLFGL